MDEPTSALSDKEVQRLFAIVRGLKAQGISVVFVTHRLEEVMRICDRATVLRDGSAGRARPRSPNSMSSASSGMMVGREVDRLFAHREQRRRRRRSRWRWRASPAPRRRARPARGHAARHQPRGAQGRDPGLAGLVGAGRTELARAIFGADPLQRGRVLVDGRGVAIRSPIDAIRAGIGLVPEDRKQQALFLALAIRNNLSVASMDRSAARLGLVRRRARGRAGRELPPKLGIRMASPDQAVGNLSGGNQQKVVLARWLALQPKVLIVDEPTRGIDVAAKAEVHALLYELAGAGIAILAISSELPEILTISDRIVTMREGRITGELSRAEASEERLMQLMALGRDRAA